MLSLHFHALSTESPLKIIKNACYFMLKAIFVLEIVIFFSLFFNWEEKRLHQKAKLNSKIYVVTDWTANN